MKLISSAENELKADPSLDVAIVDPAETHHYQPIWTLVGGGVFPREVSARPEASVIPPGATWIQAPVQGFEPDANVVVVGEGERVGYDWLVVALGLELRWGDVPGLEGAVGRDGVVSNYSYDTVGATWPALRDLRQGRALFTHPSTPIKCGGAPLKICYLAEDHFRRSGRRVRIAVEVVKGGGAIFAVQKYADALTELCTQRDIRTQFGWDLAELRPGSKEAVFREVSGEGEEVKGYDVIHVTPPMGPLAVQAPLGDGGGWVDVDSGTCRHTQRPNVFALGDCSNLPTSKTGAAVRKQAPVVAENLRAVRAGRDPVATYDGYTSCPLVTGYGRLILAEFDYSKQPRETFPFDQSRERYSMYALKAYGLPELYWNGMLRGQL